jgi:hypothetical protein
MSFPDPLAIGDDGVAKNLHRIGTTATESTYRLDDAGVIHTLLLSHDFAGVGTSRKAKAGAGSQIQRAIMRYERAYLSPDPLLTGQNQRVVVAATLTMTWPTIITALDASKRGLTIAGLATDTVLLRLAQGET